jgi:hypothetical protein
LAKNNEFLILFSNFIFAEVAEWQTHYLEVVAGQLVGVQVPPFAISNIFYYQLNISFFIRQFLGLYQPLINFHFEFFKTDFKKEIYESRRE